MKGLFSEAKKLYKVKVKETRTVIVEVEATDQWDAEKVAENNWRNSEYILGTECIEDVNFNASPAMRKITDG